MPLEIDLALKKQGTRFKLFQQAPVLSEFQQRETPAHQLSQLELHRLGEPLTGTLFDLLVAIYQEILVEENLISAELGELSRAVTGPGELSGLVESEFAAAYPDNESGFESALLRARDYVGFCLAFAWKNLGPDHLVFGEVEQCILDADRQLVEGRHQQHILELFDWREIQPVRQRKDALPEKQYPFALSPAGRMRQRYSLVYGQALSIFIVDSWTATHPPLSAARPIHVPRPGWRPGSQGKTVPRVLQDMSGNAPAATSG